MELSNSHPIGRTQKTWDGPDLTKSLVQTIPDDQAHPSVPPPLALGTAQQATG